MDEITEYLWQEQLAQLPAVAADTAATTPPQSSAQSSAPEREQPYQPNLDQLLRALSNPEVREALVKLLQPR